MSGRPTAFLAWAVEIFGHVALDRRERLRRFAEEAVELAHAGGLPESDLQAIILRVYSRRAGGVAREIGQAQACLETYAESISLCADAEAAREFERVQAIPKAEWTRRHAAKVKAGIAA